MWGMRGIWRALDLTARLRVSNGHRFQCSLVLGSLRLFGATAKLEKPRILGEPLKSKRAGLEIFFDRFSCNPTPVELLCDRTCR